MKQLFLTLLVVIMATLFFTSCQKEQVQTNETADMQQGIDESKYYTPNLSDFDIDMSSRVYWTTIPAGSTDALQDAIDNADPGGIIYLKAGNHRETERVTINKRVAIIGEDGAVLQIQTSDTIAAKNAGLYVINAPNVLIKNVDLLPFGNGAFTGVMFFKSPGSALLSSSVDGFPLGVFIEESDRIALIDNSIKNALAWGILANNGKSTYIANNEVSETGIGLWACDLYGTAENNHFFNNQFAGILLCHYTGLFGTTFYDGPNLDAQTTATYWKVRTNTFKENGEGVSIRDDAHLNFVDYNNYENNLNYDIRIPADEIFPVINTLIPAGHENFINENSSVIIKDCGINNTITGGTMVDTSVDPC